MYKQMAGVAAAALILVSCGGGGGGGPTGSSTPTPTPPPSQPDPPPPDTPSAAQQQLGTARFTTHQPDVLEQIGAHHAYARGLTGRGVRIGIDDTVVDYTQTDEFGDRVKLTHADGAVLTYRRPLGDVNRDVANCPANPSCRIWIGNSGGDPEAINLAARQIVATDGWPAGDDAVFGLDEYYPADGTVLQFYRWHELPTPYGYGEHGTAVASLAAGKNLGVAPAATIIPVAHHLQYDDDEAELEAVESAFRRLIQGASASARREFDLDWAQDIRNEYAKFDIINRAYGDRRRFAALRDMADINWYRAYLPNALNATPQTDRPDAEKTIIVYAAGNSNRLLKKSIEHPSRETKEQIQP